jgi:hypothetical protein
MPDTDSLTRKFEILTRILDERTRRLVAAAEAEALGFGGVSAVAQASGLSRGTVMRGMSELRAASTSAPGRRMRRKGAGRKRAAERDTTLKRDLDLLVEPGAEPESVLRWTCTSVRQLAAQLNRMGHMTSHRVVAEILHERGYSLTANRQSLASSERLDKAAQFQHISDMIREFQAHGQPVIAVNTRKKQLAGVGEKAELPVAEFGRSTPYEADALTPNASWVSVGADGDTAAFAAQVMRRWWESMGSVAYPNARRLLIAADAGGCSVRPWKLELQGLADGTGLEIFACHLPPGTSKWNRIEQRIYSFICHDWRGQPPVSHQVTVNHVARTAGGTGMPIRWEDGSSGAEPDGSHGDWNYFIPPKST